MMDITPMTRTQIKDRPMPDLNEFYTTDQAAKELNFTVESVRQMVYKNKIENIRFGRSILLVKGTASPISGVDKSFTAL
jgi:excisionase family DNA binding protein